MLRSAVWGLGLAAVTALVGASPAYADGGGGQVSPPSDCGGLTVCVGVDVPGAPAHHSHANAPTHHQAPASSGLGEHPGCVLHSPDGGPDTPVPCHDPSVGDFSGGCYYRRVDPQPPADDPAWAGHKPGDGAIYQKTCPLGAGQVGPAGALNPADSTIGGVWMAGPPTAAPQVDPAELAQQAVDKMTLRGPRIGITPKPGGKGVVGMPVYMWTARAPETYGPNTESASAGGITVTATATVSRIVWTMGDGHSVTCTTPGTPYEAAYGKKPSPDCGYRYAVPSSTQPSGRFHVTATSTWTIPWQGGGQNGTLTRTRTSAVDINVAEVQVVN